MGKENRLLVLDETIRMETDTFSVLYPVLDDEAAQHNNDQGKS